MADCVAKVFCPSERVRLIHDQASMRKVDSRIHLLRFDCCVFLFYSFSAVTFATQCDIARSRMDVRFRGKSGRAADITGTTEFDPTSAIGGPILL
jgi:hypothetical protein